MVAAAVIILILVSWASLASLEVFQIVYKQVQSHRLEYTSRLQGLFHKWVIYNHPSTEHAISSGMTYHQSPDLVLHLKPVTGANSGECVPEQNSICHQKKDLKFLGTFLVQYTHTHKSWPKNSFSLEREITRDMSVSCHCDRMRAPIASSSNELNLPLCAATMSPGQVQLVLAQHVPLPSCPFHGKCPHTHWVHQPLHPILQTHHCIPGLVLIFAGCLHRKIRVL